MKCYKRCGYLIHENEDVITLGKLQSILKSLADGVDVKYIGAGVLAECSAMIQSVEVGHYYQEIPEPVEIEVEVTVA